MANQFTAGFESTAKDAFDSTSATAPTRDSTRAFYGTWAMRCNKASGTQVYNQMDPGTSTLGATPKFGGFGFWYYIGTDCTATVPIAQASTGAGDLNLQARPGGKFRTGIGGTNNGAGDSGAFSTGAWHFIVVSFDTTTGTAAVNYWVDGVSQTGQTKAQASTAFSNMRLGAQGTASAMDVWFDGVQFNTTSGDFPLTANQTIGCTGIATAEALGSPTVAVVAQNVVATGLASGEAVGSPVVSAGGVFITCTGIATGQALGTPTVNQKLVAAAIASAEIMGTASVGYSAPVFGDNFNRADSAVNTGFGTAQLGGAWAGTLTGCRILSNQALMTMTAGNTRRQWLSAMLDTPNVSPFVTFSLDAATSVSPNFVYVTARQSDQDSNYYAASCNIRADARMDIEITKRVAGVSTSLATFIGAAAHIVGRLYHLQFDVNGTTLRARVWENGSATPAFQVTATDASLSTGKVGLRAFCASDQVGTLNIAFDDFGLTTQAISCTGIASSFATGTLVVTQAGGTIVATGIPSLQALGTANVGQTTVTQTIGAIGLASAGVIGADHFVGPTRYVSTTGNDANSGATLALAWRTPQRAFSAPAPPNAVVIQSTGQYDWASQLFVGSRDGILFTHATGAIVEWRDTNANKTSAHLLNMENVRRFRCTADSPANFTVRQTHAASGGGPDSQYAIDHQGTGVLFRVYYDGTKTGSANLWGGSYGHRLINIGIANKAGFGFYFRDGCDDVKVLGCEIQGCGNGGYFKEVAHYEVAYCYIHDIKRMQDDSGDSNDNGGIGVTMGPLAASTAGSSSVHDCVFENNRAISITYGYDGGDTEWFGCHDAAVYNNVYRGGSEGCQEDGTPNRTTHTMNNNSFTRNLVYGQFAWETGAYDSPVVLHRAGTNATYANNTFYCGIAGNIFRCQESASATYSAPLTGTRVVNNIIVSTVAPFQNGGVGQWRGLPLEINFNNSDATFDYNVLWNTTGGNPRMVDNNTNIYTLSQLGPGAGTWRGNTLWGDHDVWADPRFRDPTTLDFRLQVSSPAINAGVVVSGVTDGYLGAAPDAGYVEYEIIPLQIGPLSITSAEALGTATVTPGPVTIGCTGIPSGEALGTMLIVAGIKAAGIASAEAIGQLALALSAAPQSIHPQAFASAEALGNPEVIAGWTLATVGIPTGEALGTATLFFTITVYADPDTSQSIRSFDTDDDLARAGTGVGLDIDPFNPDTHIVGGANDGDFNYWWESFLRFKTGDFGVIPFGATILGATLQTYLAPIVGSVDVSNNLQMTARVFDYGSSIETDDWQDFSELSFDAAAVDLSGAAYIDGDGAVIPGYVTWVDGDGILPTIINRLGDTQLVLHPQALISGGLPPTPDTNGYLTFYNAGYAGGAEFWPKLVIVYEAPLTQTIDLDGEGLASGELAGVSQLNMQVPVSAIASGEALGTAVIVGSITTQAVPSAEAIGTARVQQVISPAAIASLEALGLAQLNQAIVVTGIASGQAIGTALIRLYITPTGIPSGEALGILRVARVTPWRRLRFVQYHAIVYSPDANGGPGTAKLELDGDMLNLVWQQRQNTSGQAAFALARHNPKVDDITWMVDHLKIFRESGAGIATVFAGKLVKPVWSPIDVLCYAWDYQAFMQLSRTGYRTSYATKKLGSELMGVEWGIAKAVSNSLFTFVTTGTVEDPLALDGTTIIKTNASFGVVDFDRLFLMQTLSEMAMANTANNVKWEITRASPHTFNLWKNYGSNKTAYAFMDPGNLSSYDFDAGKDGQRLDLATVLSDGLGGHAEYTVATTDVATSNLRRLQAAVPIRTLFGATGGTTETDQGKAALARQLVVSTRYPRSLTLQPRQGEFDPFIGNDLGDKFRVILQNAARSGDLYDGYVRWVEIAVAYDVHHGELMQLGMRGAT